MPQIYVTDMFGWTTDEAVPLYTERLKEFTGYNKKPIPLYIGLPLYRASDVTARELGWLSRRDNLAHMVRELRRFGANGFVLFTAKNLFDPAVSFELENLRQETSLQK